MPIKGRLRSRCLCVAVGLGAASLALCGVSLAAESALDRQARQDAVMLSSEIFSLADSGETGVSAYTATVAYHPKKKWLIVQASVSVHPPAAVSETSAHRFFVRIAEGLHGPHRPKLRSLDPARSQGVILSSLTSTLDLVRDNGASECPTSRPDLCDAGTRGWIIRGPTSRAI
jgi:hypothetical protein